MPKEAKGREPQIAPFNDRLNSYLKNLSLRLSTSEVPLGPQERILKIIDRNNKIAALIESPEYRSIASEEINMKGETKLGFVYCIDGRIPTIFLAGRFANAWEEPAGLIERQETANGKYIPQSTILGEALREVAAEKRDLLEVFFAHTSSVRKPNTCGYMGKLQQEGHVAEGADLTADNLRRFEQVQIPAVTELFNRAREQNGNTPLARVGISAVYETDTMGIVLNYNQGENQLSTADLINSFKEDLEGSFGESLGSFGSMREVFTDPKYFIDFSKRLLETTKHLLAWDKFSNAIDPYLARNYKDLTPKQVQSLRFVIARTMALQYVTGASEIPETGPSHHFANHEEDYLAVSMTGKTVGRFDPKEQVFGSTPSSTGAAIDNIKLKLSIMDNHGGVRQQVLFVSNPVKRADWDKYKETESEAIRRNLAINGHLFRTIVSDPILKQRIVDGNLFVVPILVDQNSGQILELPDHSVYV